MTILAVIFQSMARVSRLLAAFSLTLLALWSIDTPAQMSRQSLQNEKPAPTLQSLASWNIPVHGASVVTNLHSTPNEFSGQIRAPGLPVELSPQVVGFRPGNQGPFIVAFVLSNKSLSNFLPSLRGTPADQLAFKDLVVLVTPPAAVGTQMLLPANVGGIALPNIGGTVQKLAAASSINGIVDVSGDLGKLLQFAGAKTANLSLAGTVDPRILAGIAPSGSQLETVLLNALDLNIPLGNTLNFDGRKPPFLQFGASALVVKGVSGKLAAGIGTSLAVTVGNGLRFDSVSVNHDPVKQVLTIQSSDIKPTGNWLTLPVANASILQLAFNAVIDERNQANDQFALKGQYSLANSQAKDFSVTLSGGSPAQYAISVDAGMTLGQLLGWHPPGLDAIAIDNIQAGNGYTSGTISLQGLDFTIVAFKGGGQTATNAAFIYDAPLTLPALLPALRGTPLADLQLGNPAFVLVPKENGTKTVQLPSPVSAHLGVSTLDLKPGLNLSAQTQPLGDLAKLLSHLNINNVRLPLKGTLDPSLLTSKAGSLAEEFISAIDLTLPLGRVALPGVKQGVAFNHATLSLQGIDKGKGIDAAVKGTLSIAAGNESLAFDTSMRLEKLATGDTLSLSGTYPATWSRPLGIVWLNVRNVSLKGSLGQTNAIEISGTTDIGKVHGLTVSLDLIEKTGQTTEMELDLSGADIPLNDIPVLAKIPNANKFKLRDLTLSNLAIGGTLKTDLPLLKDARAVAFSDNAGQWNLAVLLENLSLAKLLPLPGFAQPLLGKAKLEKLAIVLSEAGINSPISALPKAAQQEMQAIFGTHQALLRISNGVNLLSSLDPSQLSPAIAKMLPASQKLALQGGISGIFGGPLALSLAADIPPVKLPPTLKFVALPNNVQTAFFINLGEASIAAGIMIDAVIGAHISGQMVTFDSTIAFELDSGGGVSIDLQGKTLSPWSNVLGIQGLRMDAGTRLELKVSVDSEVTLTFVGKSHIGKREVDLTGSASVLVAEGVIDKGALEGKLSELGIEDLMALTNGVVAAAGGAPLQNNLPVLKMTNVDVAFASPGVSIPEMKLDGGGIRVAGDLWLLLRNQPLGKAFAQVSPNGLIIDGKMANFAVGPVAFKDNVLDAKAILMPPTLPYFKVHGGVDLFGKQEDVGLSLSPTNMEMEADLDLGDLLKFDFRANGGLPQSGLSPQELAKYDMGLNAHLKSDIPAWLRKDGMKPVDAATSVIKEGLKQLVSDMNSAQKAVDDLNAKIVKAKDDARKATKGAENSLGDAQKKVDSLKSQINKKADEIADAKGHIHKCDYMKTAKVFGKKVSVPDVSKNARCESDNIDYGAKLASLGTQRESLIVAKTAADKILTNLKEGVGGTDVADLDPKVVALEGDLIVASGVLEAAKQLAQGAEQGAAMIDGAVDKFAQGKLFVLNDSLIEGSLQKAIAGKPVVMGLNFSISGKTSHMGFALSFTNPAFTIKQLDALALYVFSEVLKAAANSGGDLPPGLMKLVHEAYLVKADAVAAELDKAMKENGLE